MQVCQTNAFVVSDGEDMKVRQYREMSTDELESRLEELQKHLFDLRAQAVTEKLENTNALRNARRDIARIKTVMKARVLEAVQQKS